MLLVAAVLLLVALGLLAGGLAEASATLQWGSFAASALAALVLAAGELRRRRAGAADDGAAPAESVERAVPAPTSTASTAPPALAQSALGAAVEPATPAGSPPAQPPADLAPVRSPSSHAADRTGPPSGAHAAARVTGADGEPPVEEVEVTDLLLVLDLSDEVLVVDEHPRYHLAGCPHLAGVGTIPLPMVEARTDGFTPCGTCAPDRNLAVRERARRAG